MGVSQYVRGKFDDRTRLLYLAPMIGLRQSRQIVGEYQLTLADEIAGRRFDDVISFTKAHYDNHHRDYENESDEAALWVWALGSWSRPFGCEVPYRCLIPKGVDRLLLACRALSVTFDAHMELRMQNDMQRIGEAAGVAAALCVKQGLSLRLLHVGALQALLRRSGLLDERYRPQPAIPDAATGAAHLKLPALEAAGTDAEQATQLVWAAAHQAGANLPALVDMLRSSDAHVRFRASAALAWHGREEGLPELLECLESRSRQETGELVSVPLWQAAITFLGMARDKRAVPALVDVLQREQSNLDALIGAVRALGTTGDSDALPALRHVLRRKDLPVTRVLNAKWGTREHARRQLDLAIAEAMTRLGAPRIEVNEVIEPYREDERAYVRRFAEKVRV